MEVIKLKIEIMLGKIIVVIFTILFLETNNKILKLGVQRKVKENSIESKISNVNNGMMIILVNSIKSFGNILFIEINTNNITKCQTSTKYN